MSLHEALKIIVPLAIKAQAAYGVPAETTVAQAMIESSWMKTVIGKHNCFGMKKMPRHKIGVWRKTKEVLTDAQLKKLRRKVVSQRKASDGRWNVVIEDEFADYGSFEEAVRDYCWLLTSKGPYSAAWAAYLQHRNWKALARAIGPIYATGRGYAQLIVNVGSMPVVQNALQQARLEKL